MVKLIKHATNEEILSIIIIRCPYCKDYALNNNKENIIKLITHIRVKHIKNEFPISIRDSLLIHERGEQNGN